MGKASSNVTNTGALDDGQLDEVVGGVVAVRLSTNATVPRTAPQVDFGDRVKAGLDTAAGPVANGSAVVGGLVPGGAIISAAVSSVGVLTNNSGGTSDVVTASYG